MGARSQVRRSLLLVGVDASHADTVETALEGTGIVAERLDDPNESLDLLRQLPFDVVIVGAPLAGVDLKQYLASMRNAISPSRHAAVLLLVSPGQTTTFGELVGKGANRMIAASAPAAELQDAVRGLLDVAPRVPLRVALRLEVTIAKGRQKSLCQTENVSLTGMLVRTSQALPEGAEVRFELTLPRDTSPVRGMGRVVRQTDELREKVRGVALRLVDFENKDRQRYQAFVAGLTVPPG